MSGWIKITREMIDHPYVGISNPLRFAAWAWMLKEACWKDTQTEISGKPVTLNRGQFAHSLRFMADATGMTFKQVRLFLDGLEQRQMVSKKGTPGGKSVTVVTVCNYDKYQSEENQKGTPKDEQRAHQGHIKGTDKKKGRREEGKKKDIGVSFSAFWDLWGPLGGKVNRGSAEPAWNKLSEEDREKAFRAAPSWFSAWRRANPSASPIHASTYLNKRRFEDEAAPTPTNGARNERPRTTAYDRAAADQTNVLGALIAEGRRRDQEAGIGEGTEDPLDTSERGMAGGPGSGAVVTWLPVGERQSDCGRLGSGLDGCSGGFPSDGHRRSV